jgi:hypothetical protein
MWPSNNSLSAQTQNTYYYYQGSDITKSRRWYSTTTDSIMTVHEKHCTEEFSWSSKKREGWDVRGGGGCSWGAAEACDRWPQADKRVAALAPQQRRSVPALVHTRSAQQLFGHWKDASAINSGWIER